VLASFQIRLANSLSNSVIEFTLALTIENTSGIQKRLVSLLLKENLQTTEMKKA